MSCAAQGRPEGTNSRCGAGGEAQDHPRHSAMQWQMSCGAEQHPPPLTLPSPCSPQVAPGQLAYGSSTSKSLALHSTRTGAAPSPRFLPAPARAAGAGGSNVSHRRFSPAGDGGSSEQDVYPKATCPFDITSPGLLRVWLTAPKCRVIAPLGLRVTTDTGTTRCHGKSSQCCPSEQLCPPGCALLLDHVHLPGEWLLLAAKSSLHPLTIWVTTAPGPTKDPTYGQG